MLLFSISCSNKETTGGGGGVYNVPTATGNAATDLTDATYSGNLNLVSYEPPEIKDALDDPLIGFQLQIAGNKIVRSGAYNGLVNVQILKTASGEYNASGTSNDGGTSVKEYIKFTVSGNNVEILEWTAVVSADGQGHKQTYKGSLTKQ